MPDIRVVLADDHSIVRKGLRSVIEDDASVSVVGEAATGLEAVAVCHELQPDVVVLDIAMPSLNGIDAIASIQKGAPLTRALILSMHSDESYVLRALGAGARGYLLKDAAEHDVLPAIRAIAAGDSFLSPAIAQTLLEDYVRSLRQRGLQDSYDLLTERERQVLQLLAEGRSNKEVAQVLNLAVSTVDSHRANLMQKLNLHSTAEIVLYAMRKRIIS
jgi:DNA-binding NarL/FixJ family response regulator